MTSTDGPGRADAVKGWLSELLDTPRASRIELITRLRVEAPDVADEVMELYRAHEDAEVERLQPTERAAGAKPRAFPRPEAPAELGRYLIQEQLGEGGMATVFRARQTEPIDRSVAVKVLRPEVSTPDVVARFRNERQLLARLDHPGIARIVDAGEAPDGRAYLVMDLVDGRPIDEVCRDERTPLSERVRLVIEVAAAVQHAHGRGVLHRDLKASNVLVARTERGLRPTVIDFGIAKVVGNDALPPDLQRTRAGQIVGTLESMSPEQAGFGDGVVDARSDVYSLAVLLYELIAERLPLRVEGSGIAALSSFIQRLEREMPAAPSTVRPANLPVDVSRATLSDLDCVVLRALSRDPQQRYSTAAAFAADLERALGGLPVDARPPTRGYLFARFARRNRKLVLAGGAAVLSLVVGISGVSFGLVQEQAHAASLASALSESNELIDSYASLLLGARADRLGPETPISVVVEDAAQRILDDTTLSDAARGRLACAAGEALHDLEKNGRAEELLTLADALLAASALTKAHLLERSEVQYRLALLASDRGAPEVARAWYGKALDLMQGLAERGEADEPILRWIVSLEASLATVLDDMGDSMAAIPLQVDALERLIDLNAPGHETSSRHADIAITLMRAGDYAAAERHARAAYVDRGDRLPAGDMRRINATRLLADALLRLGRAEESAELITGLEAAMSLPASDPRRALVHVSAAQARYEADRAPTTAAELAAAARDAMDVFGPEHPRTERLRVHEIDASLIDPAYDAGPAIDAVLATIEARTGPGHPSLHGAQLQVGRALLRAGRGAASRPHMLAARDGFLALNSGRPPIVDRIEAELSASP
ncbi:MAG: serine/threonine-protein kinase [Planctomycetota bacterium]